MLLGPFNSSFSPGLIAARVLAPAGRWVLTPAAVVLESDRLIPASMRTAGPRFPIVTRQRVVRVLITSS